MSKQSIRTILERPSRILPTSSRSPYRPVLGGTLPLDAPAHLAAGTVEIDEHDCDCDFGCNECEPTVAR